MPLNILSCSEVRGSGGGSERGESVVERGIDRFRFASLGDRPVIEGELAPFDPVPPIYL